VRHTASGGSLVTLPMQQWLVVDVRQPVKQNTYSASIPYLSVIETVHLVRDRLQDVQ
jgi:hypothetical protein